MNYGPYRIDVLPIKKIILGQFIVAGRSSIGGDVTAILGYNESRTVTFSRKQSKPLAVRPVLHRNGIRLPAKAQAMVTIEPSSSNATPTINGLYDLSWDVHIDWTKLSKITPFAIGDILNVHMHFPKSSVSHLIADLEILERGINATVFETPESLLEKDYDETREFEETYIDEDGNEQTRTVDRKLTEKDYLDDLIKALQAAGLVVDANGNIDFPKAFMDPTKKRINWERAGEALEALRAAIEAYKMAKREITKNGKITDCLEKAKEWRIVVKVKMKNKNGDLVNVEIVIVIGAKGKKASATDGKAKKDDKASKLIIAIGRCGEDATKDAKNKITDATDGGSAGVEIKRPGSIGIAMGGDGGGESEVGVVRDGADGGDSEAKVKETATGAVGIAVGGVGGGVKTLGGKVTQGNGGDANTDAEKGADAKVVGMGGDSGYGEEPKKKPYKSGKTATKNGDSVKGHTKEKRGEYIENDGRAGTAIGPITRAEPKQGAEGAKARHRETAPTTGS